MLKAGPEHLNKRVVCNHCRNPFVARPEAQEPLFSPPRFAVNPEAAGARPSLLTSASIGAGQATETGPAPRIEASMGPRVEPLEERAREAERLQTALKDAKAELDRQRLTVKILQADLFTRASEIERLEAGCAAASSESARLSAAMAQLEQALARAVARHDALESDHARALAEARAGWERERQALVDRAEVALAACDQAEKDKAQLAGRLRDALTRFGAAAAELETERSRAEQLEAERRREDAERDRQQAETAKLRAEIEQQRLRWEAERQAQQEAFTTLRQTLAGRLQTRTPAPSELPVEPASIGTGASGQAHDCGNCEAACGTSTTST
jgi:hypothetical protein